MEYNSPMELWPDLERLTVQNDFAAPGKAYHATIAASFLGTGFGTYHSL